MTVISFSDGPDLSVMWMMNMLNDGEPRWLNRHNSSRPLNAGNKPSFPNIYLLVREGQGLNYYIDIQTNILCLCIAFISFFIILLIIWILFRCFFYFNVLFYWLFYLIILISLIITFIFYTFSFFNLVFSLIIIYNNNIVIT